MTLDLGWQGMQSKFWVGVLSFVGLALVAFAQDEGVEATTNKTGVTQVAPASSGAGAVSQDDTGTAAAALEGIADAVIDSVDGAQTEAADLNSKKRPRRQQRMTTTLPLSGLAKIDPCLFRSIFKVTAHV